MPNLRSGDSSGDAKKCLPEKREINLLCGNDKCSEFRVAGRPAHERAARKVLVSFCARLDRIPVLREVCDKGHCCARQVGARAASDAAKNPMHARMAHAQLRMPLKIQTCKKKE